MKKLIDQHGRYIHKLRLALLDACNFRCLYCMPEEQQSFLAKNKLMTREDIFSVSKKMVNLGIDEIRLTGGEPCLRNDLISIVNDLSTLRLHKLGLTTNGVYLKKNLAELKKSKCHFLNISLDSLNQERFKKFSGRDQLELVLESIFMAKEMGFEVKINTVLMKGYNDHEVESFLAFSKEYQIEVRFLELMKIGVGARYFEDCFISAQEIIDQIQKYHSLAEVDVPLDSTAFKFRVDNDALIGFIASESKPFCSGCSRLRLSAIGEIRPCLMLNHGISLLDKTEDQMSLIIDKTLNLKPIDRIENVDQNMNQIGG